MPSIAGATTSSPRHSTPSRSRQTTGESVRGSLRRLVERPLERLAVVLVVRPHRHRDFSGAHERRCGHPGEGGTAPGRSARSRSRGRSPVPVRTPRPRRGSDRCGSRRGEGLPHRALVGLEVADLLEEHHRGVRVLRREQETSPFLERLVCRLHHAVSLLCGQRLTCPRTNGAGAPFSSPSEEFVTYAAACSTGCALHPTT